MAEFKGIYPDGLRLPSRKPGGKISRRELLKLVLPFPALIKDLTNSRENSPKGMDDANAVSSGMVKLDKTQCTGCNLCALNCPTEALTTLAKEDTDHYQLLFHHNLCDACGQCVEVCPEQCLRLERVLELDKTDSPAIVLFEASLAHCRECGSIIGSRALITRIENKLATNEKSLLSALELCPDCKTKRLSLKSTVSD